MGNISEFTWILKVSGEVGNEKSNEETATVSYLHFTFPEYLIERGGGEGREFFFSYEVTAVTLQAKENEKKERPNWLTDLSCYNTKIVPLRYLTVKWLRCIDGPISRMNVKYPVKVSMTIQRKPKYDKERKSIVKMIENGRKHMFHEKSIQLLGSVTL